MSKNHDAMRADVLACPEPIMDCKCVSGERRIPAKRLNNALVFLSRLLLLTKRIRRPNPRANAYNSRG